MTVLFTDLVGFTSRAEELDPEDVRAMLTPYYARLREQIEQRGGTVEKFIGDAVMAVFGAPVAHEDDPVRAVLTALAIRDGSPDLEIRTAVNTGEALVSLDADPSAGEAFVSGDVVNTAARLQSAAPVNGILVGEAAYRATRHVIDYREAEPVEAKGKSKPVPVWEVIAARPRFGTDVEETHRSALVGRERELSLLTDAFARCRSEETAQLVTLVGVPGIGKSRLVAELFSVLDADPDVYWWRQGRSLPYGESRSVWALGEIVKAQAGILESDDAQTALEKLAAACSDEWVLSHLRALAGVAGEIDESQDRRVEAFSAWRRFFETLAEERPLVLVFEDLHWADDTLLDFVDHLAEWVSGVPMLLIGTARPELVDRRPGWGGGKRNATTLSIGALSNEETAKLLPVLPAETQQLVLERAEGNPLYAGEFARMVADHPGAEVRLPETVQGLIAARIDQLAAEEKALLQDAAVLGKVFWPSALESASDEALHGLERKEFIRRDRRSSVAGEMQYAFLHLLVRDVAYSQIPRARRMERHRAAAEWIEGLAPDRSEDRAEMLAHHYREALRLADAAGADTTPFRGPARDALAEASERAAALNSWNTAGELATAALGLTGDDDPLRPALELRLARATVRTGTPDVARAESARDGFLAHGSLEQAAETEALLSWMHWWRGEGELGREHALRSLELVQGLPTSVPKARAYAQAARRAAIADAFSPEALELGHETLAMAEELGHDELTSNALNTIGLTMTALGDPQGLAYLERSVELADRSKVPDEMTKSRNNLGTRLWVLGRLDEAQALFAQTHDISLRYGSGDGLLWAKMERAAGSLGLGDLDAVLESTDELLAATTDEQQVNTATRYLRGWVQAVRGQLDKALPASEEVVERGRRQADPQVLGPTLVLRTFVLHAAGRSSEANARADEMLGLEALTKAMDTEQVALVLAELGRSSDYMRLVEDGMAGSPWIDAGVAVSDAEYGRAADIYGGIGARFLEAWARLLAAEGGDLAQLEAARSYFEPQRATPFVRRCEAVRAASA